MADKSISVDDNLDNVMEFEKGKGTNNSKDSCNIEDVGINDMALVFSPGRGRQRVETKTDMQTNSSFNPKLREMKPVDEIDNEDHGNNYQMPERRTNENRDLRDTDSMRSSNYLNGDQEIDLDKDLIFKDKNKERLDSEEGSQVEFRPKSQRSGSSLFASQ